MSDDPPERPRKKRRRRRRSPEAPRARRAKARGAEKASAEEDSAEEHSAEEHSAEEHSAEEPKLRRSAHAPERRLGLSATVAIVGLALVGSHASEVGAMVVVVGLLAFGYSVHSYGRLGVDRAGAAGK